MARRPIKIKRYSNMGARYRRRPVVVKALLFLLAAAVLFTLGWFGASRCIDAVTNFWYKNFSVSESESASGSAPESQSVSQSQSASSKPEPAPQPPAADTASEQQGTWGEVALSAFASENTLRAALQQLVDAGVDHALVTLKDDRGYIYYESAVELAATAGAVRSNADVALFAKLCKEYGLVPCARLTAFRDPLAATGELAVLYGQADGPRWLDSSPELGGKPWLNPYSAAARQYLLDLAAELDGAGITDVVFAGVQFPTGYSLDKCYYGEEADAVTRTECLRQVVSLLQTALEADGQRAWFEWPEQAALAQPDALTYGEGVAACSAQRVLLVATVTHTAEGLPVLPACDADALAAFAAAAAQNGTQRLGLNLEALATDPQLLQTWQQAAEQTGFTHFKQWN